MASDASDSSNSSGSSGSSNDSNSSGAPTSSTSSVSPCVGCSVSGASAASSANAVGSIESISTSANTSARILLFIVQIPLLSFVFPAKTHSPRTSQNIFLQHTIFALNFQPRPVPPSSRLSNLNLFRTFQFRFRFPYIFRKKIRFLRKKRTAGTDRSLFLCN